jgi:hypothetical protein
MNCSEIREFLSDHVDDLLDPETRTMVEAHLEGCFSCRLELGELKSLIGRLSSLTPPDPPEDFLRRLQEKMDRPPGMARLLSRLVAPFRSRMPLQLAGALITAVLVVSIVTYQYHPGGPKKASDTVGREAMVFQEAKPGPPVARERETALFHESRKEAKPSPRAGSDFPPQREVSVAPSIPAKAEDRSPMELTLLFKEIPSDYLADRATAPMLSAPPSSPEASIRTDRNKGGLSREAMKEEARERPEFDGYRARGQGIPAEERLGSFTDSGFHALRLPELLESLGGVIVSSDREPGTGRLKTLLTRIPSNRLDEFYEAMKEVASPGQPFPRPQGEESQILLRITCLYE